MKIEKNNKKSIIKKSDKLKKIAQQLKKEYIGLDDVIDEISNLVEPWYLFPDGQLRPTVINLWGMTSTGKTSLILRLFELLDLKSVLKFDVGEWVDKTDFELTTKISTQIRKVKKDNLIPIFMFDEFQLGRTIDDTGDEIDRPSLRVIWDLLDTGKFSVFEDKWETNTIIKLYQKLCHLLNDKKVEVKNGRITKNKDAWDLIFIEDPEDEFNDKEEELLSKFYPKDAFIPSNKLWTLKTLNEDKFYSEIQLAEFLKTLNGKEILEFLENTIEKSYAPVEHNFSDSIIFVIGNLDSAYYGSEQMSPDIDADTLYQHTEKITISSIKEALSLKYRPEQISRLGNNHIIYKSFTEKMYKEIIDLELRKINTKLNNKFDIEINFDNSVKDIIYKEGVFPTQGVRPIFSTITSLIESYVGRIIVDSLKLKLDIEKVDWKFKNDEYIILLKTHKDKDKKICYPVKLKIDSIRKSISDDIQSLVGIHEAGHVITSVYALNICPKLVVSRNAEGNGGFTHIDLPHFESKNLILNDIICLIGGYCAEKLIFGEDNITTGSFNDLEKTTTNALKLIKEYGMNGIPLQFSTPDFRISNKSICLNDDELDRESMCLVKKCMEKCETILKNNMKLLLHIGDYLSKNSKLTSIEIKKMIEEFGEYVPEYKTKDNYYDYKKILCEEMKKIDKK